jgi:hypothetical protein
MNCRTRSEPRLPNIVATQHVLGDGIKADISEDADTTSNQGAIDQPAPAGGYAAVGYHAGFASSPLIVAAARLLHLGDKALIPGVPLYEVRHKLALGDHRYALSPDCIKHTSYKL